MYSDHVNGQLALTWASHWPAHAITNWPADLRYGSLKVGGQCYADSLQLDGRISSLKVGCRTTRIKYLAWTVRSVQVSNVYAPSFKNYCPPGCQRPPIFSSGYQLWKYTRLALTAAFVRQRRFVCLLISVLCHNFFLYTSNLSTVICESQIIYIDVLVVWLTALYLLHRLVDSSILLPLDWHPCQLNSPLIDSLVNMVILWFTRVRHKAVVVSPISPDWHEHRDDR